MKKYERWEVHGYRRPVLDFTRDGEAFDTGGWDDVVVVRDGDREWHVTIEQDSTGAPTITSLMLRGGEIDQTALRQVALSYLAEAAAGFVGQVEAGRDGGAPLDEALMEAASKPGEVTVTGVVSSRVEEVAAAWLSTLPRVIVDGERIGRRKALSKKFNLSEASIDKYVREARDLGLITEQPRTGRKRRGPEPRTSA